MRGPLFGRVFLQGRFVLFLLRSESDKAFLPSFPVARVGADAAEFL